MYVDQDGKLQLEASPSIAGSGGSIFTPDVTDRFMDMIVPTPNMQFPRECGIVFLTKIEHHTDCIPSSRPISNSSLTLGRAIQPDMDASRPNTPCRAHSLRMAIPPEPTETSRCQTDRNGETTTQVQFSATDSSTRADNSSSR